MIIVLWTVDVERGKAYRNLPRRTHNNSQSDGLYRTAKTRKRILIFIYDVNLEVLSIIPQG